MSDLEDDHENVTWFGREAGSTRKAVDEMLTDSAKIRGRERVVAELARMSADLVDSARAEQDPRLWLAASQRLMILIDKRAKDGVGIQEELFSTIAEEAE